MSESEAFPWGMAGSNRIQTLAKGCINEKWSVLYVGLKGAVSKREKWDVYPHRGIRYGIPYIYPGGVTVRPGNWWVRRLDDVLGFVGSFFSFFGKSRQERFI